VTYSAGKHWPTLGLPPTEPYQPPTDRRRPRVGWPTTGTTGAKQTMDVDTELPAPLPARPYADVHLTRGQQLDRIGQLLTVAGAEARAAGSLIARAIGWFRR
jgi:hypothetical protein